MALHRLTAAAAAGVLVLGLAGCGGDPQPSASSAAPKPTPSVSATGPVAPVLPDLAKRDDAIGAKAFVKYWFDAVTYAMHTGDTEPFMAVSAKECKTCSNLVREVRAIYDEGRLSGGGWTVEAVEADPKSNAPLYRFAVRVRQAPQSIRHQSGRVTDRQGKQSFLFYAGTRWSNGFEFLGLDRIDE
ncbi:DUF6318 family protein [Nocardioides jejuensis]|uniref:DUF6318 domain-containing protein n=1 Tax=Nocardioides jejuensis TaxID=2502782 RepID=A0A4R1CFT5_9ACTN|nr:DUF6318 family protein [Nocardioides jejuensis]TCJ28928.1 hypothetical protein EPD65_07105 [Nocardioides jejuensis]